MYDECLHSHPLPQMGSFQAADSYMLCIYSRTISYGTTRALSLLYSYYYCSSHLVIIIYTLFDGRYGQLDVRSRVRFIPIKYIGNDVSQGIVAIKPCLLRS